MLPRGDRQPGRNTPCPCGSGKKYKRCCLERGSGEQISDSPQSQQTQELTSAIIAYARETFEDFVPDAWSDFHLGGESRPFSWTAPEQMIFMPYFLFHWDPESAQRSRRKLPEGGVVAQTFLASRRTWLTGLRRVILEQAMNQPVSFYQVVSSKPGLSFLLADVLTGAQSEVIEHTASRQAKPGALLYGSLWNLPDSTILGYSAPIQIPLSWKAEIIHLRKRLQRRVARQKRLLQASDLLRYADEIRASYLRIRDSFEAPLRLANTDGDPLEFHTLTFKTDSPKRALEALAPLAVGRSRKEILSGAEWDAAGELRAVELDWLKKGNSKIAGWNNTILGNLKISGQSLVAEVNSESRARRLRAEIEKRLGTAAVHQTTVVQSVDQMRAKLAKGNKREEQKGNQAASDLLRDPKVREHLQKIVQQQVEAWVHQKVPLLGNRTPIQAVRDPDGKEIVEALLLDWEQRASQGLYQPGIRPDFSAVRRLLRLNPSRS